MEKNHSPESIVRGSEAILAKGLQI